MSADMTIDIDQGVAVLTLNRPEHLNAYTAEMGALLSRAYRDCGADDDVRAIVVTGAGRAFASGRISRATSRRSTPLRPTAGFLPRHPGGRRGRQIRCGASVCIGSCSVT